MEQLGGSTASGGESLGPEGQSSQSALPLPRRDVDVETAGWIALALETIFGWFGILGVGQAYVGRLGVGIGLFLGWLLVLGALSALAAVTFGIAACVAVPVWLSGPFVSGLLARRYALANQQTGSWGRALAFGGIGCLGIILLICVGASLVLVFFGSLAALLETVGQQ